VKFSLSHYILLRILLIAALTTMYGCLPSSTSTPTGNSDDVLAVIEGEASYYADEFEGRATASGEPYRATELTAAHRSWEFGTMVRVTNLSNNQQVIVRVNDRGPWKNSRIIDISRQAATEIGMISSGVARVRLEVLKWGP
jgi:rare lipoprotein A